MQTASRKLCANFVKLLKEILISSFLLSKKNLWLGILLFFVVSEIFFPLHRADAVLGILGGIADGIGKAIGAVIAGFLTAIPGAIFGVAALILQWSIDPKFINVPSYTKGAIVDIGWPIVRDLANMGIVMALVVIGLATALRLEEYQARKTLPRLILIALLINFTPVILGFIVDFTNIAMYFFLDGLMGIGAVTRVFASIHSLVVSDLGGFNFFNPLQQWIFVLKIIIIWIFFILAAIIFLLFAFLFIIRRIAIWMLVILSPLAFVAWILPGTRKFWSTWWNQFLQWSIIGVFAAFFLYLGDHMIGMAASGNFTGSAPEGFGGWIVRPVITMLEQMMPYVVALIFLLLGFFIALTTSAMGAAGIISATQKGVRKAGAGMGAVGVNWARGTEAGQRIERGTTKWAERIGVLAPGTYESRREQDRKSMEKNLTALPSAQIQTEILDRAPRTRDQRLRRAQAMKVLAERNDLEARHQQYIQEAVNLGVPPSTFYKAMPNWAVPGSPGIAVGAPPQIRQNVERQSPEEFRKNIRPHAFETPPPPGAPPGTPSAYTNENLDVFYGMDMRKAREIGLRGNRAQKESLRNLAIARFTDVAAHVTALRTAGTPVDTREAKKIEDMWMHIYSDPNFAT
jgi:hypothetical protein